MCHISIDCSDARHRVHVTHCLYSLTKIVREVRKPNMDLLFLEAKPIPSHAITALAAVIIGGIQLASAKGTRQHQLLGYLWVSMMMYVAISSFFISEIQLWGAFSPIHLLSAWTVFTLCTGVYFARVGNIKAHQWNMVLLYVLALILTGLFTLLPSRVMGQMLFGG